MRFAVHQVAVAAFPIGNRLSGGVCLRESPLCRASGAPKALKDTVNGDEVWQFGHGQISGKSGDKQVQECESRRFRIDDGRRRLILAVVTGISENSGMEAISSTGASGLANLAGTGLRVEA